MPKVMSDAEIIDALRTFYATDLEESRRSPITGALMPEKSHHSEIGRLSLGIYKPQVALFWGKDIAFSQLDIYRPYLKRTRQRAIIIAKSLKTKTPESIELPNTPVFVNSEGFKPSADIFGIKSLDTILHITESGENYAFIKGFPNFIHVYANHGDSDKHSNAVRTATVYDFVMVAGRASMLRFPQAGLAVPQEKFVAIGGTPIEGVEVVEKTVKIRNILYAPTWEGHQEAVNFSSVHKVAASVISLSAKGYQMRFRPHPGLGKRSTLHKALSSDIRAATTFDSRTDKASDFNWSDLIVSDISGVMSEYLFTGKPIVVPVGGADDWVRHYLTETSLNDFIYLWNCETQDFDDVARLVAQDPLREQRLARREEMFLGARSVEALCRHFDQALDLFGQVRAQRAKLSPRIRREAMIDDELFCATPPDPALAEIVQQIRAGTLILGCGVDSGRSHRPKGLAKPPRGFAKKLFSRSFLLGKP